MEQATDPDFIQQSLVPWPSETHGGEDLGIYAIGPWSHLFQGTVEENSALRTVEEDRVGRKAAAPPRQLLPLPNRRGCSSNKGQLINYRSRCQPCTGSQGAQNCLAGLARVLCDRRGFERF